jgi:hypothetical protein
LELLEAPYLKNENEITPKEQSPAKRTTWRHTPEEKASAVRVVRALPERWGPITGSWSLVEARRNA